MTQKELLYLEDAIGHEKNIIAICRWTIDNLQDEQLKSFIEEEVKGHMSMKEKLMTILEVKAND